MVIGGFFSDCNGNSYEDRFDIDEGTSQDLNRDLIPDECQIIVAATSQQQVLILAAILITFGSSMIYLRNRRVA